MTQRSLVFDKPTTCGWCLMEPATTMHYATPSCLRCATNTSKARVNAWLKAVEKRKQGA